MVKCSEDCFPICDFCKHYEDYGIDEFQGDGICLKKDIEVECCDSCNDDFHCFRVKEVN